MFLFFCFCFLIASSPLLNSLLLLSMAIALSINFSYLNSMWIALALALIFIGGMMILLIYVCSLSMNNKMFWSLNYKMFILFIFFFPTDMLQWHSKSLLLYSTPGNSIMIFLVCYLLMILMLALKMAESFSGALVRKF